MVQDPPGDDGVERTRVVQLFERDLPVQGTGWGLGVDRENVVARRGERGRDTTLTAAADLEHAAWRRRQLREHEGGEVQDTKPA